VISTHCLDGLLDGLSETAVNNAPNTGNSNCK